MVHMYIFVLFQTEDIAQVTYEVDWYTNYRPKFRKMLSLIMQRSQKASQITAGGVWYLNMNTFGQVWLEVVKIVLQQFDLLRFQILRGSMSLLAFMQTIYANKRNQKQVGIAQNIEMKA